MYAIRSYYDVFEIVVVHAHRPDVDRKVGRGNVLDIGMQDRRQRQGVVVEIRAHRIAAGLEIIV